MKKSTTQRHVSPKALLGLLVALTVAFLLLLSVISVAEKYIGIKRHIRELTAEKAELQEKHERFESRNAYLKTTDGTEQLLREKYNVIKPGEGIVVVVDPAQMSAERTVSDERSWWQKLLAGLGIGTD